MTTGTVTKVGVVERILSKFASTEAKILAEHLHRLPEENDYFVFAQELFDEGYFTPIDYIYLRLAMHENAVAGTKANILCNVLEVKRNPYKVQPDQVKRARRKS
jgi:hypothetical protein